MTYKTLAEIESLVGAFEDCVLPRSCWTHQAHLTVALWYLTHFSEEQAINCMRDRIRKYNVATGVENTKNSGYHETITLFWLRVISNYLISEIQVYELVDIANKLLNTYKNSGLVFEYYSRNLLLSFVARSNWIEPNLKPLSYLFENSKINEHI
ncbi:hypothetical protein [Aliterella atlantica]|uniref:Uncharacterized protein n=1 Tax=Aliterella atlantica CENA595 TaxID=1618023 RepID=A0A0D8ZTD4_9CYAN|nr:hypothetical protein [Aliterella atlantica]KJH71709.1 hypothetical protein UH38_11030 [Aliterella atlantica CENA595]